MYYRTKVHVSIRAKMYICKFCTFRCVDVDSFCKESVSKQFLTDYCSSLYKHFYVYSIFFFSICAEGQQLNCFIRLQYLIYDREIINVLSKWAFCDFVSLSSIYIYFFPFFEYLKSSSTQNGYRIAL